jgi:hypothetical protein
MVTFFADSAEFFEYLPETELANPAGTSKSIDLEPFRIDMILRGFKPCICNTYEELSSDPHKSFIFSE